MVRLKHYFEIKKLIQREDFKLKNCYGAHPSLQTFKIDEKYLIYA
jgi:sulfur relay (sulfurtransferase) DsrF/TusC family protein